MKKKIVSLLAALTISASVLCMNVNAAGIVYKNDFNNPPESGIVADMEGWKGYDSARTAGASFEDGAVKLERYEEGSVSGYALYDINYNAGSTYDHIVTFDVKMTGGVFNFAGWFYMGLQRLSLPSNLDDGMEEDKWYTFAFQATNSDGGAQKASFYRKGPWTSDAEKAECEFEYITSAPGSDRAEAPHINIGANNAPVGGAIYIDNIEVAEKDFLGNVTFKADGEIIETAEEAKGADIITAEAIIFSGTNLTPELNVEQSILPVLLVFDMDGRMLDCQMQTENIGKLYNRVTTTIDAGEWSDDTDRIQFCVWDSIFDIQPIFDSVELN